MRQLLASALLLSLLLVDSPSVSWAVPPRIVGDVQVDEYHIVRLHAEGDTTGAAILWDIVPEDAVDIDEMIQGADCHFTGPAGTYRAKIRVLKVVGNTVTIVSTDRKTIIIGKVIPPVPPTPPVPPIPPDPVDPVPLGIISAWAQETGAAKVAQARLLASIYRKTIADGFGNATTVGEHWNGFKAAVDANLLPSAIPKLRIAIGTELSKILPTATNAPLDGPTRSLITMSYTRIARYLEALQ